MPSLDIKRLQFLHKVIAEMRHDLVFAKLAIALGRPGGDIGPMLAAPCHALIDEGGGRITRHRQAGAVLDQLLAAGLSQWEPDPMAALAETKGNKRKAAKL
jgi:hypothetical protein